MAEGLRARGCKRSKPSYYEEDGADDDDLEGAAAQLERSDDADEELMTMMMNEASCPLCKSSGGKLISCDSCDAAYHLDCLDPPRPASTKDAWTCLKCSEPLADIEKFLDKSHAAPEGDDTDVVVNKYLVKWKSKSYLHCSWVLQTELERACKLLPGLRMKLNHFNRQHDSSKTAMFEEEQPVIRSEWTTVDRIINLRKSGDRKEYLVKWKELGYDEVTWEDEDSIQSFRSQIERYESLMSRGPKKRKGGDASKDGKKNLVTMEATPHFLSGGDLHPYQLEGLNFLRYARKQQKHVILADEMGLGKTIQSIAFLASLASEGNVDPHLVVAPLSTLRNWEREFTTWAPHMNTVVYAGSAQARANIREHEFYYPKKKDKAKRKHYSDKNRSKQERLKFDVLLTSYEMINSDTSVLKSIKWDCLIVDEGHRLKSKDSKLFQTLQHYVTYHRVLLTGTPLQNNLDELFTLMHFLDESKFASQEKFQEEFRDINHEEQVRRLHKMLSAHLLRRVKKDVLKQLPPKKELMLRVELSLMQKEYYKAVLARNYDILSRQISLNNVVMELRKVCGHPYLLEGVQPDNVDAETLERQRVEASGKLYLLDKMMVKLKSQGHRVLIYSQFQRMLDILEDWITDKKWSYERIDGNVSGAERQIRIDRFNAPNSNRFCFLLSTRAGGLGINLATADTVVIYDSDWNPHADLQAMARAHRLGQKNMVMIYRLVTRGSIEERMMQMTKKKMVLEHLVVGRMKNQMLNQEELNDILTYGAKELFVDDNEDSGKSRQIHYDDAAIDRLLNRSEHGVDEMSVNEDDNDLLKAFKVANFEYVDEDAKDKVVKTQKGSSEFWETLLKDKYVEEQKCHLPAEMGKGKRSRKQVYRHENLDDDLAGMDYVSSEDEDIETEDYNPPNDGNLKRPKKKPRVEAFDPPALMEGEGKSLKILGFKKKHRALFVQVLMRFGLGDFSWSGFLPHFKQKAIEEIKEYGTLFLTHIAEDITDSSVFSDGVPKEGLRIQDVLVRVAVLHLITNKVRRGSEHPTARLFSDATYAKFSALRQLKHWREEHDWKLLRAIVQHGYGRWLDIVEDYQYDLESTIRQELMLPPVTSSGTINGSAVVEADSPDEDDQTGTRETEPHASKRTVDFVKRRISLLERVLNAEYHQKNDQDATNAQFCNQVHPVDQEQLLETTPREAPAAPAATPAAAPTIGIPSAAAATLYVSYPIPLERQDVLAASLDNDPKRGEVAQLYNQMCTLLSENRMDAFQTYVGNKSAGVRLRKCIRQVDIICSQMRRCLGLKSQQNPTSSSEEKTNNGHGATGCDADTAAMSDVDNNTLALGENDATTPIVIIE